MSKNEHPSVLFPQGSVEVSRIMTPDDTNIAGNVHGGTIMKMIGEAGAIIATRHCNGNRHANDSPPVWAVIARVEKTDFVKPMFVGEVATIHADLTYSSKRFKFWFSQRTLHMAGSTRISLLTRHVYGMFLSSIAKQWTG